jgi:protein MpaA
VIMIRNLLIVLAIVTLVGCLVMLPESDPQSVATAPVESVAVETVPADSPVVEAATTQTIPVVNEPVAPSTVAVDDAVAATEPVTAIPDTVSAASELDDTRESPVVPETAAISEKHQEAVSALCREIGNKLGSVTVNDCSKQQLQFADGFSVNNRVLTKRDFVPQDLSEPASRIMIMGGIHGDEYSSISIMFKWMDLLAGQQDSEFHWRFMPLANPDGLLDGEATRQNANGVDLNRNFPSGDWERTALESWRQTTGSNPRRFPGHSPASEPETQWILQQIEEFKPVVIVSVHAPHALLDFDGPVEAPHKIGHLHLHQLGVYPGSLGNYGGLDLGIPVITLELPSAGIMPSRAEIENMWVDLNDWLSDKAPGLTESRRQGSGISAD